MFSQVPGKEGRCVKMPDNELPSGPIILQSEGAELFYRAIEGRKINAIPAEFAER